MSKLIIVESPHKAKTISSFLGPDYVVRATMGHISDLPMKNLGVNVLKDFQPRYEILPDKADKIKAILDIAKISDEVFIASDPDREGEAIAFHIKEQIESVNSNIKRAEFHEITKKAVERALKTPRQLDQNLYSAQQARRVLDRIVGYTVSPLVSKLLKEQLSAGRVQSVALKLIVDREDEINYFIVESYYNINVKVSKDKKGFDIKYSEKVKDSALASKLKDDLSSGKYIVDSIKADKKFKEPAPPLTTSKLQQEASAKYRITAEDTMKAAQSLYEAGLITYMRTDSVRSSPESIEELRNFLKSKGFITAKEIRFFKNKDAAQDAHEAIRPTDISNIPERTKIHDERQKKIYELVWRFFAASQMEDAEYDTVSANILNGEHLLKAEGKILKNPGWISIMKQILKADNDIILPDLKDGDELEFVSIKVEEKKTQPPSRFNDGTLVKELEKKEIGRPSTYAAIISRISGRQYVKKTTKGFVPTEIGISLVKKLEKAFSFMDYKYTANMEKQLDLVAEGKIEYIQMMRWFFDSFKKEYSKAKTVDATVVGISCPKCGENMIVRRSRFGFFAGCITFPKCNAVIGINMIEGKPVVKTEQYKLDNNVLCPECSSPMTYREDGPFGPFYSCGTFPKCKGTRKITTGESCPQCKHNLVYVAIKKKLVVGCSGYPNCNFSKPLPEDASINWTHPDDLVPPKTPNKINKLVSALSNQKIKPNES